MTLADIKDYLKSAVECPEWYVGRIDGNREKCIGICPAETTAVPNIAIGGRQNTTYAKRSAKVVLHWGYNAAKAEKKAWEIYEALLWKQPKISEYSVILFEMAASEPVGLGTDEKGIYEYAIEFIVYYKKRER